jgi:Caspase domain
MSERPARSALIVANDEYVDPRLRQLRAPVRDAEELARVLADPAIGDFEVDVVLNEPEHRVRRKLSEFFADRSRDDLLLVHFSCHGLKDDDGSLYFAAPDSVVGHLDSTAVSAEFVNRQMRRSRSRRIALFLDCCYSGAFSRGTSARAGDGLELAERFDGQGQVVITASTATEYAFEGDELTGSGTPSVFTTAIVEGLDSGEADRDGDGFVSIDELYDYVYDRVRERTPSQTPSKWTYDLQGELYVARNRNPRPPEPAELPVDLRQALENRLAFVRAGAVSELELLLGGTNRRLAAAARAALEGLTGDDSRSVSDAAAAVLARHGAADAPSLDEPLAASVGSRVRAVVVDEPAAAPEPPRTPDDAPAPTAADAGEEPAVAQRRRFVRRAQRPAPTETPPAAAERPRPLAAPVPAPAPADAAARARGRVAFGAAAVAAVAVVLLLAGWLKLATPIGAHYTPEGLGAPLAVAVAVGALLRSARGRGFAAGALLGLGVAGMGFAVDSPRYDVANLQLDERGLLLAGYACLSLAGLIACLHADAAEPALVGGRRGRPALAASIAVVLGALLLLAGVSYAWTYADNNGSELGMWRNDAGAGRAGLLLVLAAVAVTGGILGLRRVPRPRVVAGAATGLGLLVVAHFLYLAFQIAGFDELYPRIGTALGLAAGVVIVAAGLVAVRATAASRRAAPDAG